MYRFLINVALSIFIVNSPILSFGVPIGDTCSRNEDCDGYPESTICDDVIGCYCNEEHLPVRGDTITCEKIRQEIGEQCKIKDQCTRGETGNLSDCLPSWIDPSTTICNCTEDAIHEPGQHKCHLKRNFLGETCEVNAQCSFYLSEWGHCSNGECSCRSGSVPANERDKCLPIRYELGSECSNKLQCTLGTPGGYSDCVEPYEAEEDVAISKICNCTNIAINEPGDHTCFLRREKVGQPCNVNAQCIVNLGDLSKCDQTCSCMEGLAVPNDNQNFCLAIVNEIGEECKEAQQCTEGVPGDLSNCMPSYEDELIMVCNCSSDAINQPGKNTCLKKAVIVGDSCVEEAQCTHNLGTLTECHLPNSNPNNEGICKCIEGAISTEEGNHCLAIRQQLGNQCDEARQCQSGIPGYYSTCLLGKCVCAPGATNEPGEHLCRERANIVGGPCQVNSQCKANLGELSECLRGEICTCTPIFSVPNIDQTLCLPVINSIGGRCDEPQQCQFGEPGEYSDCKLSSLVPGSMICNCSDGAIHQSGYHKCYKVADRIGAECMIQEQCQYLVGEHSQCTEDNQCQCIPNRSIPNSDDSKCLRIIDTIGDQCTESRQCTSGIPGEYSECICSNVFPYEYVCSCKPEAIQHPSQHECLRKAIKVEDTCSHDQQCTINLGNLTKCSNDGKCQCITGSVANLEGIPFTNCIPGGIFINKECFDKAQCVGLPDITSTCAFGKVCGCLETYTHSNDLNDCLAIRNFLGDTCKEPQQCQQGIPGRYSECTSMSDDVSACKCTEVSTNEAGRHVCYLKATSVGDPCESNVQCVSNLEQSQCLNGHCECMANSTESSNGRKCLTKAYLGQPCQDKNQCSPVPNAACLQKDENEETEEYICKCDVGYMEHPFALNTCIRMAVVVGDYCNFHPDQCNSLIGATCQSNSINSSCECNIEEEVVSTDQTACLKTIYDLHSSCIEDKQCQVQNSNCLNATSGQQECMCNTNGFVENSDATKCLPVRGKIGHPCEDSNQCKNISLQVECISGFCLCMPPYDNYEENCFVPARLGGHCETNPQCRLGVNELSVCDRHNNCVCVETAFEVADSCWASKVVGDKCQDDVECTISIIGQVYCNQQTLRCNCREGYKADYGGIRCSSAFSTIIMNSNIMFIMFSALLSILL